MKKLHDIKALVDRLHDLKELTLHGFTFKDKGTLFRETGHGCSCMGIYIHERKRVVVKANYICYSKPERYAVPTVETRMKRDGNTILIQPLCRKNQTKAFRDQVRKFINRIEPDLDYCNDIVDRNIMQYGNRLVVVDW